MQSYLNSLHLLDHKISVAIPQSNILAMPVVDGISVACELRNAQQTALKYAQFTQFDMQ